MSKKKQAEKEANHKIVLDPVEAVKAVTRSPFLQEFGEFINRGNVVELAIGVAVGGAFTTIVKSLVDDIIMPLASLMAGGLDFSTLSIDIPNVFGVDSTAHIAYGNFLQNIVNFLLIAFTVFVLVRTLNRLNDRAKEAKEQAEKALEKSEEKPKNKKLK